MKNFDCFYDVDSSKQPIRVFLPKLSGLGSSLLRKSEGNFPIVLESVDTKIDGGHIVNTGMHVGERFALTFDGSEWSSRELECGAE